MQTLSWRFRRLLGMSPAEMAWRARSAVREVLDAQRVARGRYPRPPLARGGLDRPGFRVCDLEVGEWAVLEAKEPAFEWCRRLRARADAISAHRLSLFGRPEQDLGDPIDWNRDHESGRKAPLGPAAFLDYRDYDAAGDARVVWEPNRHHHLVVLGRAYRATGDARYALALREQLDSWLRQCPYGRGLNWRSPLELALRLINWVFALDLVRESGALDPGFTARVREAVYLHLWSIARRYSRGSSANNHLIGEAAGVFVGSSYFREFAESPRWRDHSRAILCAEILEQTHPDGGGREQALGYHLFVLQLFVVAAVVGRRTGEPFPSSYWSRLQKMFEFAGALSEGGESLPMFGDGDDGYVLDLGSGPLPARELLAMAAVLFGRPEFKAWARGYPEAVRWLLGAGSRAAFEAVPDGIPEELRSRACPASGHYLLQCGRRDQPDAVSVVFDCGELGYKSIAAHGHADALSFTLRAFGRDVLVDPGTYDYFRHRDWRDYFRSTRAHNTVVVDDVDQSVMQGPFLWGARARARCLAWSPGPPRSVVCGEHDGYRRLADPVLHRRCLELDGRARRLVIRDQLEAAGGHRAALYFHVSEECRVASRGSNRFVLTVGGERLTLALDPRLSVSILTGSEQPIGGWVSRGYHLKTPSATVVGQAEWSGPTAFECRVDIGRPGEEPPC